MSRRNLRYRPLKMEKLMFLGKNKRSPKKNSKRPPTNKSPTTGNSCDKSPIEVNLKRARYDCPDHSDDSDMGDGTGLKICLLQTWMLLFNKKH